MFRWLGDYDDKPGFSQQEVDTLKDKAARDIRYRRCAVMIDGIHIRKRLDWDAKQINMAVGKIKAPCTPLQFPT